MSKVIYVERTTGKIEEEIVAGEGSIHFLNHNFLGRIILENFFKKRFLSKLVGWFANTRYSAGYVVPFCIDIGIDLEESQKKPGEFTSFNDFFSRKLKDGVRPIDSDEKSIVMPADGRVSVIQKLDEDRVFQVKGVDFKLADFVGEQLSKEYHNGSLVIVRLCPADYHRYHFPFDCTPGEPRTITGDFYSVNPMAIQYKPDLFVKNERQITVLERGQKDDVLFVEVGATIVGKIIQTFTPKKEVKKGDEKGYFLFGGSTCVLIFKENNIQFAEDLVKNSENGMETRCLMGSLLGYSL
jgi:phosphatidylserine decarboxylase